MIVRTSDQILAAALTRLVAETSVTVTSPGSVARTFYEIIAEEMGHNYKIMDANISQMFVSTAGGAALEKLGTLFGVTRLSSSVPIDKNEGRVYFYLNSSPSHVPGTSDIFNEGTAISIPKGTLISTNNIDGAIFSNPIVFKTTEDAVIETNAHMVFVSIEVVESTVNTVSEGMVNFHNISGQSTLYVYNRTDLQLVEGSESDINLRYRIANAINGSAKANTLALRLAALGSIGVRDCKVVPLAYGVGTAKVVITMEQPSSVPGVTTKFSNASQAVKSAASVGDVIECVMPAETLVSLSAVIMGDNISTRIKDLAKRAAIRYISSLSVGEALSTSKLTSEILSVSPQIRDFAIIGSGFTPNGSPSDYGFQINGRPTVYSRVEAKEDEQFYTTAASIVIL
jgi:uncharacterized phage protein gp47/JayE